MPSPSPQGERIAGADFKQRPLSSASGPTVTGVGPLGQTTALEMLALHHNIPFRRDVIERAAQDNLRTEINES